MDKVIFFLLCFYHCSAKIKINRLDVPSSILYGSQSDVILDCDFDSGGDEVTEVKWFLDGNTQIYQWLPSANRKAQAIGKLKNHIDVNYKATNDANTMYRALHITDLSPDFSGNYTCKVSSLTSEDVKTKRMIIYATPGGLPSEDLFDADILDMDILEETSEIICTAGSFYPKPNMTLYVTNSNETEILLQQDDEEYLLNEDGHYNVTSTLSYANASLTENFHCICQINIPGTPYSINETWIHTHETNSDILQLDEEILITSTTTPSSVQEVTENGSSTLKASLIMTTLLLFLLGLMTQ